MQTSKGFIMMNVIFLTLIVSFTALIFLRGTEILGSDSNSTCRLIAINLANEQFAEIENLASEGRLSVGKKNFLGDAQDLKNFGLYSSTDKTPVEFEVETEVKNYSGNLCKVEILVRWTLVDKDFELPFEKIVRVKNLDTDSDD